MPNMKKPSKKRIAIALSVFGVLFVLWFFSLPRTLFSPEYSTVLLDREGKLLGARIAQDGQWRFPPGDSVPVKFEKCLLTYEDRAFHSHPGVRLTSIFRALVQNVEEGRIVSGASTITMQLMRMAGNHTSRTPAVKFYEIVQATRAEARYSKEEILLLYTSHAPFGGNVVGLEAASWRYFLKPSHALTWAENAALAVLPNAPGLIYPGRNPEAFKRKRDQLLGELLNEGIIDEETYRLSLLEDLPGLPFALPQLAYHLTSSVNPGATYRTTVDKRLQMRVNDAVESRLTGLRRNRVDNAAVLVADNKTGEILAYVGNGSITGKDDGSANDMITTPRSSGSILKPFLYAAMMREGMITPKTLVADVPTQYAGFAPRNFNFAYAGAVPADEVLAQSLNVPSVRMLKQYGIEPFADDLKNFGFTTLWRSPEDYGLSLILGGAEVTLFDLVKAYRSIALAAEPEPGVPDVPPLSVLSAATDDAREPHTVDAGVAWATLEAMAKVTRPDELAGWQAFGSSRKVAWKTGTSHGFRDAWAVGVTPGHTIAVWVGNAGGEGRPGMTGLQAAGPLLFDVVEFLPHTGWFEMPEYAVVETPVCVHSGMRASTRCGDVRKDFIPAVTSGTPACDYCRTMHFDRSGRYRVNAQCYPKEEIVSRGVFQLPALQAWFYRDYVPGYVSRFRWYEACEGGENRPAMQLIYPLDPSRVFLPREVDGLREKIVLRAAHLDPGARIYWHLDDRYLGETTNGMHYMEVDLSPGSHVLTMVDDGGERLTSTLKVEGVQIIYRLP